MLAGLVGKSGHIVGREIDAPLAGLAGKILDPFRRVGGQPLPFHGVGQDAGTATRVTGEHENSYLPA
ncbi:MAG: hypothetical protein J2P17_14500 [Mycobacterium sp.]|nr:hypothetical protein [Mycobacterium sp.]